MTSETLIPRKHRLVSVLSIVVLLASVRSVSADGAVTVRIQAVDLMVYAKQQGVVRVRVTFTADVPFATRLPVYGPGNWGAATFGYNALADISITNPDGSTLTATERVEFITSYVSPASALLGSGPRHLLGRAEDTTVVNMSDFAPLVRALEGTTFHTDGGQTIQVIEVQKGPIGASVQAKGHYPECEDGSDAWLTGHLMSIHKDVVR